MSIQDMIKKSVLESGVFDSFNAPKMAISLIVALLLGAVIYMVYSKFYVGVIFSRSFAVTLVGMTLLTCMVTLAISTNIVISLGMVGALSIVRFRTAVKDPMDLLYLFWAITTGITTGAGMYPLALNTKSTVEATSSTSFTFFTISFLTPSGIGVSIFQRPPTASSYVFPAERGLAATVTTSNQG